MCGIAGWFSRAPLAEAVATAALARADAALAHRGPDGSGVLREGHASFVHRRLAVIDLDTGDQPMWSADRRAAIVFNGEIYNYRARRAALLARGVELGTKSDTEVVVNAWLEGGAQGFAPLRGMYAFGLWDRAARCGVLARDPLGIKPLFVMERDGDLWFASEAKAILAMRGERGTLDEGALHLLLNLRYPAGETTLLRGIRQLAPGEVLHWTPGRGSTSTRIGAPVQAAYPDLAAALDDSVLAHLTSDVEVGCYLSGGIDSATVAALAARHLEAGPRTFTLPVGDDPREAANAAATAAALGLQNLVGAPFDEHAVALEPVLASLEVPKVNALQSFALARHARASVKVALSGLGGDELFLGYNAHRIMAKASAVARWLPRRVARVLGAGAARTFAAVAAAPHGEPERAARMLAASSDWPAVYGLLRNAWDSPAMRAFLYGPRMRDVALPDANAWLRSNWPRDADPLSAMAAFEWSHKMVNDLLWHEDRAGMSCGLEVRVPFVDRQLLGHVRAHAAPDRARLGKRELRSAVAGVVPDAVLARPKSGFQLDAPAVFSGPLAGYLDEWLSPARVRDAGLFAPAAIAALRALSATRGHRWHWFQLFLMAQAQHWLALFEGGTFAAPGRAPHASAA
ncbi:MAG TPA: asparagine synthase (glutamine-hydrolyzing) [Xanthomonadales bacterium]|nr:asparagine synthase (glutamine-hydrolyzing) [Xanthomonadales bacterium]